MALPNNQLNRDEYERKIAADISSRRVEAEPQDADEIIAEAPEDEELEDDELAPTEAGGEEIPREAAKPSQIPKYEHKIEPQGYQPEPSVEAKGKPEAGAGAAKPTAGAETGTPKRGISGVYDGAKQKVADAKDQAVEWAKEQLKKLAWKAIKEAAAAVVKAAGAFLAEGGWVPVLIILILVGLTIAAFALWPNRSLGSTITQQTDILGDHPLIKTVLAMSNSADFQKLLAENKEKLTTEINSFKNKINSEYPSDPRTEPTTAKLDEALRLIAAYTTTDAAKAKEIRDKILEAVKPWSVTLNPGGLIFPAAGFNAQNVGRGQDYLNRGVHRGIDRGLPIGTTYRAPADSEIVYLIEGMCQDGVDLGYGCNGGFGNTIIGRITADNQWNGYFWEIHHLKKNSASPYGIKVGSVVKQGQIIGLSGHNGKSSKPHIHFQIDKPEAASGGFPVGIGREKQTIDPYIPLGWPRK